MCRPVFPSTDHPDREPLIPSVPLPVGWTHCYHASFETVELRVPVRYGKNALPIQLPLISRVGHLVAIGEDDARRAKLMHASQAVNLAPMPKFRERAPFPASSEGRDSLLSSRQSASLGTHTVSVASVDEDDMSKPVPPPIAAVSYDLAAVSSLEDPQDLMAEINRIDVCPMPS